MIYIRKKESTTFKYMISSSFQQTKIKYSNIQIIKTEYLENGDEQKANIKKYFNTIYFNVLSPQQFL